MVHEREQEHVAFTNRQARINGCLIIGMAVGCCLLLYLGSPGLRRASKRSAILEILFTVLLLVLFQVVF